MNHYPLRPPKEGEVYDVTVPCDETGIMLKLDKNSLIKVVSKNVGETVIPLKPGDWLVRDKKAFNNWYVSFVQMR